MVKERNNRNETKGDSFPDTMTYKVSQNASYV